MTATAYSERLLGTSLLGNMSGSSTSGTVRQIDEEAHRWYELMLEMAEKRASHAEAASMVLHLASAARAACDSWPLPITTAEDGGSIDLEWNTPERYLQLTVMADGSVEWFYRNTPQRETCEGAEFDDRFLSKLRFFA